MVELEPLSKSDLKQKTVPQSRSFLRADVQKVLRRAAQFTLGLAVLLSAFRYRFVIFELSFPPIYKDYTDGLFFVGDLFLLITIALWLACLVIVPRRISFGPYILTLPLAGLLIVSLMSVSFSIQPMISAYHFVRLVILSAFYLFLVNEIRTIGSIIWALAGGVLIQSVVSIGQILEQHSLGLASLGELELDPAWSGVSIVWAQGIRSLRAYGLTDHPNILGGILAFALLLILSWYVKRTTSSIVILGSIFIAGLLALFFTFSRSAWLAFLVGSGLITFLFWRKGDSSALINGMYLALASLIISAPFIGHNSGYLGVRLNANNSFQEVGYEARSLIERQALNAAANEIFTSHAVTGVGLGTFPLALKQAKPDFPFYYQPPHNTLLHASAETGIFGALFYFMALLAPWLSVLWNRKRLDYSPSLIGVLGALAAVTVVGFFDYYTWLLAPGRFWQWFLWGLWGAFYRLSLVSKAEYD